MSATQQRFQLGQTCATPGALEALSEAGQDAAQFLRRHQAGDWGNLSDEDKQENEFSVDKDLRIFSTYHLSDGTKIWLITEVLQLFCCRVSIDSRAGARLLALEKPRTKIQIFCGLK